MRGGCGQVSAADDLCRAARVPAGHVVSAAAPQLHCVRAAAASAVARLVDGDPADEGRIGSAALKCSAREESTTMKGTLTPRTYPIYLSGAVKLAAFAAAPLLTVAGGFVLFYAWRQTPLGLIFLLFGLAVWYQILFTPYRIVVQADQTIHI